MMVWKWLHSVSASRFAEGQSLKSVGIPKMGGIDAFASKPTVPRAVLPHGKKGLPTAAL